ncbi:MAG TPA: amino acid adenylation domain-containing protein [Thermoanaerobaculia bacterium]|nr:amino acid adenylation domain-containing protein [Thermoanaerobaculia bacterium]
MSRPPLPSPLLDRAALAAWLTGQAAHRLQVPAARIDPGQPLVGLGLDSLSAIELAHDVETALGISLPLAGLLEGWSVGDLAGVLLAELAAGERQTGQALPDAGRNEAAETAEAGDIPLSAGQRGLWFLSRLAPESGAYNIVAAARVRGGLDPTALERAFQELVARHGALRTTFPVEAGEPRQRVAARSEPDFVVVDAAAWDEARVAAYLAAEGYRPFDLGEGPLLRVRVLCRDGEHAVLLAVHHLVSDFSSLAVLVRELAPLYRAAQSGLPADLPPLLSTYGDFVRWQAALLAGPEGERQWRYWQAWRERRAGDLPVLDLPADRPRPPFQSDRGDAVPLRLPGETLERLRALGRRSGATLYMTLLAAFQVLLHRHTGDEEILVGSPTAGRSAAALAGVMGYFVNPLVLRADLEDDPSFTAFLAQVRRTVLDAFAHSDLPFPLLAERLQPERDPSRPPVFQVFFVLQGGSGNAPLAAFALGESGVELPLADLILTPLPVPERRAQFDLTWMAAELPGGLAAHLEYNADLFDRTTMRRLAGHLEILLEGIAERPEASVGTLPLLSAPERAQLLAEWSAEGEALPSDLCLHQLVAAQAARTPGACALVWQEERLTYAELADRAGRLAHRLRRLGVGPEVPVAICARRSPALVAGLLGILAAGGAYVPLEPGLPDERLGFLLRSSGAPLLVTEAGLAERLAAIAGALPGGIRVLRLDAPEEEEEEVGEEAGAAAGLAVLPGHLAYVMYTSGSTGQPKGVAISHASAVAFVRWAREVFPPAALAGVLAATSIGFDLSVFELFVPLAWGGRVILADDALELPYLPARGEVTLLNSVPSVVAELLRLAPLPPAVRTVNLCGEVLSAALVRQLQTAGTSGNTPGTPKRILNLYGPTEDTVYSTFATVSEAAGESPGTSPPIGRPLPGTRVHVVDRRLRPVPAGVPGELLLGGQGLARGYLGRPDLTAERFVPDPCGPPGERLYRTGDLVRFRPDGGLEYLGRLDHQVKVRGFRIELGEVEAVLATHPAVAGAAVLVQGAGADRRLVAFLVRAGGAGEAGAEELVAELRSFLGDRLPEYMLPAAFVPLAALPLTPNGKLDRRELARLAPAPGAPGGGRSPRGAIEEGLAAIWGEILGVERVGAEDSFFDLGGHSLLATRLLARVRVAFGVDLSLAGLFAAPTVAGLAERVAAARAARTTPPIPPLLPRGEAARSAPLSFAQLRLWFLHRLAPESPAYNMPAAVRLRGRLDPMALAASLEVILARHEALRTRFVLQGDEPFQVPAATGPFVLPRVDLAALPAPRREAVALRLAGEEARRPFPDLAGAAPCRFLLLRLGEEEHLLLATFHHLVADGGSLPVFGRELSAFYAAGVSGQASPLPPLLVQYADWAVWQRCWAAGAVEEKELAGWEEHLAGAPTDLPLPADRPASTSPSGRGAVGSFDLPAALGPALAALAREERTTLFVTLAAGFLALLSRLTGADDLLLGTPVAHRRAPEVEGLIGLFVNTVALRGDLSGRPGFRALLGRTREEVLAAHLHPDLPLGHHPLFQVVLTLDEPPLEGVELPGLALEWVAVTSGTAKFDLTFAVTRRLAGLTAALEYATDRFDATTARRLLGAFATLLAGAVAAPERPLAEIDLLSPAERHQVEREWNDTAVDLEERSLGEVFLRQAERRPEAVAVAAGAEQLSYGELARRSDRLARWLAAQGVGPEVPVGLALERSVGLIVAMLAVVRAGGVYVPLDPGYPRERLDLLIRESGAQVVLGEGDMAVRNAPLLASPLIQPPPSQGGGTPSPDQLAYLIYTSGSTGAPKGVAVTHRAVRRLIEGARYVRLTPEDRIAQASTPSFDAATFEIWGALLSGARLEVFPPGPLSLAELGREVRRTEVTVLWLTAGLFHPMIESHAGDLSGVGQLLAGGDVLSPPHVALARRLLPGRRLVNGYGPTEGTTFTCCADLDEVDPGRPVPIGRPIANTTVAVLDRELQPLPIGAAGELCAGGLGLARGYWGDPARTAERFVPDPLGETSGARRYRTGDRARLLADGRIEILGRLDRQVKVRGFRIEPGEVEAALVSHPDVRAAAVEARPAPPARGGGRRLVAWVVGTPGMPGAAALRRYLLGKLPEPAVPSAFVFLPALPLTAQGKVDRRALAEPAEEEEAGESIAPRTPFEEVLAGIWCEVLGRERLGAADDFFALGGHSLLATRVASRVRSAFGVEIPLSLLFEAPTLAGLAARIEATLRAEGADDPAPPLLPVPRDGDLPLSFPQERLWFLDQLEPESPFYNIAGAVRLAGALAVPALERSLAEVVARHEALRTTFTVSVGAGGVAVQRIAPPGRFVLPAIDLASLPEPRRDAEALRLAAGLAMRPFDLARGPLFRPALLRLDAARHLLALVVHHIVADGWSIEVLRREVAALYGAFSQGRPSPLPPLPLQYADFAVWQRRRLAGAVLARELAHWRRALPAVPEVLALPADRPRPARQSFVGGEVRSRLPPAVRAGLVALARREGASLFMVLAVAFAALLARHTGQEELAIGTPVANRGHREIEGLIGLFVNTLVLRADLAGDPSFAALLARVRRAALDAYAHEELPFERLVAELAPRRDAGHPPLFQALFSLEDLAGETGVPSTADPPGLSLSPEILPDTGAKFDLSLIAKSADGSLQLTWSYARALFDRTTVARQAGHFAVLLAGLLADPGRRLSALPLLAAAEVQQVEQEWNDTEGDLGDEACPHQLFAAQAARTPDAVALEMEGDSLTYGELAARARRLARHLAAQGVRPETRVAVFLPRSPLSISALLGLWSAGGVYLPLPVGYPRERLAYLLADGAPGVILTRGDLLERLPEHGARVILLDALGREENEPERSEAPNAPPVQPVHLSYLLYTSGSTGRPKGVMIEHRNLAHLLRAYRADLRLGAGDVMPAWTPASFDPALLEGFTLLLAGGRVLVIPEERALDLPFLTAALRGATALDGVPSLYRQIALHLEETGQTRGWEPIHRLTVGGESVSTDLLRTLHRLFPRAELRNSYGPTEATVLCTSYPAHARGLRGDVIGRPLANMTLHLRDRAGQPVPIGVPGEIWIGGAGVGRGYFGRPDLTAERFSTFGGGRAFRTGDLARLWPDGNVEFLGRIDDQVKIRGVRIEPGEIAATLAGHPAVAEAAVVVREEPTGKRLVAYVVPRPGVLPGVLPGIPTAAELRALAARRLPEAMIPAAFVFLAELPRTRHGKLDRAALPAPERPRADTAHAAPRNDLERSLAAVWQDLLGGAGSGEVGIDDNFFELGGDSLLLLRLRSRLTAVVGRELPVVDLFQHPTIRSLAESLEGERAANAANTSGIATPSNDDAQARTQSRRESLARLREQRGRRRET